MQPRRRNAARVRREKQGRRYPAGRHRIEVAVAYFTLPDLNGPRTSSRVAHRHPRARQPSPDIEEMAVADPLCRWEIAGWTSALADSQLFTPRSATAVAGRQAPDRPGDPLNWRRPAVIDPFRPLAASASMAENGRLPPLHATLSVARHWRGEER